MTDSATNTHRIETQGLVKTFGQRAVVNGVDLEVNAGEIVGLLGPNGAGKTTTFYMIVGLVAATSGKVLINGKDATKLKMHQRARLGLGYLPQEPSTFRKLTVAQNLLAIVETMPVPRGERAAVVNQHLEELHLTHVAKQKAYTLSGGERRRLEIARALGITEGTIKAHMRAMMQVAGVKNRTALVATCSPVPRHRDTSA